MSAILSVDDLNDFISPGVACIKPVETLPAASASASASAAAAATEVVLDGQAAQISLTDCLACSGCVTSAEAVLVGLQSHAEVLSTLDRAPGLRVAGPDGDGRYGVAGLEDQDARLFVASVSPQTRASLAAACGGGVSEARAGRLLESLLRGPGGLAAGGRWNNGFTWVLDTNVARDVALVLGADEVLQATSSSSSSRESAAAPPAQPVLSSACPGWVCYAEKTHPHVLPHLSRVKSPQALMGTMLKTTLSRILDVPPARIWHLAVMPCFDKKLEASRQELTDEAWAPPSALPGRGVRDVDCVITSKEILMLAESRGLDFFDMGRDADLLPSPPPPFPDDRLHAFLFPDRATTTSATTTTTTTRRVPRSAGSSGGLLYHILQRQAARLPGAEIQTTRGRNADVVEFVVAVGSEPVFKAARYYGFRNIQNLVRKLKPARQPRMPGGKPFGSARRPAGKSAPLEYGYVEVMACPGGCTNGGGQIKVDDPVMMQRRRQFAARPGPQEQREWLAEVDEAYFSGQELDGGAAGDNGAAWAGEADGRDAVGGISRQYIHDILAYWSSITGISIDRLAFTAYREVVSDVGKGAGADKVVQLAGKAGGGW